MTRTREGFRAKIFKFCEANCHSVSSCVPRRDLIFRSLIVPFFFPVECRVEVWWKSRTYLISVMAALPRGVSNIASEKFDVAYVNTTMIKNMNKQWRSREWFLESYSVLCAEGGNPL